MSGLRSWLADGVAQRWLSAAAIMLSLGMIGGLVVVVVVISGAAFWPRPLVEFTLADGNRVLGEETEREPDTATAGRIRTRIKVANREVLGADFRWVPDTEVVARRLPADAWLLERREYGAFHGFPVALSVETGSVAAGDPAFPSTLGTAMARARALLAEERQLLRRVDRLHAPVAALERKITAAERRGRDVTTLRERRDAVAAHEQAELGGVLEKLPAIRERLSRESLLMRTTDGVEKSVPISAIVRAMPVNALSTSQKLSVYASRWSEFLFDEPRESNTEGGIFPAIFGTALMVMLMTIVVVPLGVVTAVYLNEYARDTFFTRAVRLALANLAGVPSIVFGAFGLAFFVWTLGGALDRLFFADVLPNPTFGTGGILWASLTLALLTVPVVVVATEEGLQAVPQAVRDGARALGATRWQTLRRVVLPYASPGILTGAILAVARGAGEVAPLMLTGVVKLAPALAVDLQPPFLHLDRKFMHLGFHIYDVGFQSPNVEAAKAMVYVTVLVLLVLVVALNLTAIALRTRLRRRLRSAAV
ncbi:MAG: phosphate ABC transporter permease PstA [Acidobacteriota bacterium]